LRTFECWAYPAAWRIRCFGNLVIKKLLLLTIAGVKMILTG
jgi:hypothetical protein